MTQETPSVRRPLGLPGRAWFVAAMVGLLLGALGFTTGVILTKPQATASAAAHPADGSTDAGFARDMANHHAQAVSMGLDEYRATSDSELRTLAVDIALTQQAQIGIMQTWLRTWDLPLTSAAEPMAWMPNGKASLTPDGLMPGMATEAELARLRAATGQAKDVLFCQMMIRHHLGGIHMIDAALAKATDPGVKRLAEQMKTAQQYDIKAMTDKLKKLGAAP